MSEYVMKLYRCTLLGLYFIFVCTLCDIYIYRTFVFVQFSFLTLFCMHHSLFFTSHITTNTVYIKHSGRNFISVCQVIYLGFFCWYARLCTFVGAFYVFDVWKPWYLSYRCHIIIILWSTEPGTNAQYSQSKFNIAKY